MGGISDKNAIYRINDLEKSLEEKNKEIERLRKEKEWLIIRCVKHSSYAWDLATEILLKEMQQALKEGE